MKEPYEIIQLELQPELQAFFDLIEYMNSYRDRLLEKAGISADRIGTIVDTKQLCLPPSNT